MAGLWQRLWQGARAQAGRLAETKLLALDFETSGLEPVKDHILSVGAVPIIGGHIRMDGAYYTLVAPPQVQDDPGVMVHGLGHAVLAQGAALCDALSETLSRLEGAILLAHGAAVEKGFLAAEARRCGMTLPAYSVIDTLALEQARLARSGRPMEAGALRLAAARKRYGLPRYRAHHALTDALACAELFLAQMAHGGRGSDSSLGPYIRRA